MELSLRLCPSPELYQYYHKEGASVVIVDIFRATTTITTAFINGVKGIIPVASIEEAEAFAKQGQYIVAAERNVQRCSFADLGNDPMEYTEELVKGQKLVMTTTNGTKAIKIAFETGAKEVLIGSFLNLKSLVENCLTNKIKDLIVLAAGWQGQMATEDSLYAGALSHYLEKHIAIVKNDGAKLMQDLWEAHCLDFESRLAYLSHSEHYARLKANGFSEAAAYCLKILEEQVPLPFLTQKGNQLELIM